MKRFGKILMQLTLLMGFAFVVSACEAKEQSVTFVSGDGEGYVVETLLEAKGDKLSRMKETLTLTYSDEIDDATKEQMKESMDATFDAEFGELKGVTVEVLEFEEDKLIYVIEADFTKADLETYKYYAEESFEEKDMKRGLSFKETSQGCEDSGAVKK